MYNVKLFRTMIEESLILMGGAGARKFVAWPPVLKGYLLKATKLKNNLLT